jgi:uroporphyrin-III C-methyltransferase
LIENPDILAEVGALEPRPFVVGFAAETQNLEAHARAKLERKRVDLIAANCVGEGAGFDCGDNELLLISRDGAELLARADVVVHDRLSSAQLLDLAPRTATRIDVGKAPGRAPVSQREIDQLLVEHGKTGATVVRLKGGDPFVFGRGGEELHDLQQAGIDVVVVPGITTAFAAPAAAGISVTRRGVASSVAVTTAKRDGNLDRLSELAQASDTLVVLMALTDLAEIAAVLSRALGGSRPAALISNATLPDQRTVGGTLDTITRLAHEAAIEAPATLVVGEVVGAASIVIDSFRHNLTQGGSSQAAAAVAVAQPG